MPERASRYMTTLSKLRSFVLFALVLFVDISSKYWVAHHLPVIQPYLGYPFGGIGLLKTSLVTFSLVHTTNTGIAWGMLSDYQILLLICRIAITLALIGYLAFGNSLKHLTRMSLTLIAAGATGNILDFFFYGHVIDMFYLILHRYSYPVFNVADAAIFCAAVYLLLTSKRTRSHRHA